MARAAVPEALSGEWARVGTMGSLGALQQSNGETTLQLRLGAIQGSVHWYAYEHLANSPNSPLLGGVLHSLRFVCV